MAGIVQKIAARAAIIKDGRVLLIRESSSYDEGSNAGKWDFPGGRAAAGESVSESLKRETKEECGLDIEIGQPFFVGEWRPVVKGNQLQVIAIYFICTVMSYEVKSGTDHDEYRWLNPAEKIDFDLLPPNDEVLKILAAL